MNDDGPRRNPSRCLSETTLCEMVSDGPKAPQDVIPPDSNSGLSASVAMRAATVLRTFHPELDECRGAILRYVRRVAVPAIARHVLYRFDERVMSYDDECGEPAEWDERAEHKDSLMSNDFWDDHFRVKHGLPKHIDDEDDWDEWGEEIVETDESWLRFCLETKSKCPGFAGYKKPRKEKDWDFLAALPDRVLAALSEKPPQITLDFCAYLRSAHGVSSVDDIEFSEYNVNEDADARLPSMSLNFLNVYSRRWGGGRSEYVACFNATVAYLPSFEQARPVPVQFCPYNFPHGQFYRPELRRITAHEVCAMGPVGASYRRLREAPTGA